MSLLDGWAVPPPPDLCTFASPPPSSPIVSPSPPPPTLFLKIGYLEKIVSGGQTGADFAGLRAARRAGLLTGGWAPKGWKTQDGSALWLADFGLVEFSEEGYKPRTDANVRDSDATIRFARDFRSPGEICTLHAIEKYKKPYLDVGVDRVDEEMIRTCARFLFENKVRVLNVAGNSERTAPGIGRVIEECLVRVFDELRNTKIKLNGVFSRKENSIAMSFDTRNELPLCALDLETYLAGAVNVPKIVCGSWAKKSGSGLADAVEITEIASVLFQGNDIICGANIAYDLACLASTAPAFFFPFIYKAFREDRIYDVLIAEALNAIYRGNLGEDPRTEDDLRSEEGKLTRRYSLWNVTGLVLGRWDAKKNDVWRKSYALLDKITIDRWPWEARQYPIDDAVNTYEVALGQIDGSRGRHEWLNKPLEEGSELTVRVCIYCDIGAAYSGALYPCKKASKSEPHRNRENLGAQTEFAFAIYLGACHGLRTDGERVEALAEAVEEKSRIAQERYQKLGWLRENGTEDQIAIKKALAIAYGATGTCARCGGSGRVPSRKWMECRGVKDRGRYRGCGQSLCTCCGGTGKYEVVAGEATCQAADGGCDGTGFDIANAKMVARTDKGRIKADRDAKMESGNDDLHDFGVDEFTKIKNTYVPYLRKGIHAPIYFKPNPLLKSGRCSYGISDEDHRGEPIQQFPRKPLLDDAGKPIYFKGMPLGVRECVCARPGCVLCSTDYSSGELCTLAQCTKWIVGFSRMLDLINETRDPGSLHTMLGAQMIGISFEEMKARIKAGDKQAKEFRQAAKAGNFGLPGGLGAATLVLTNRKKSAGTTKLRNGKELAGIRFCILIDGALECGIEKVTEWKGREYAPMCRRCVEIAEHVLKKVFFQTYPEVKKYLDWVTQYTEANNNTIPQYAWDHERGERVILRVRGGVGFCDAANQNFQGLLADIFKRAYCRLTWEAYLGVKPDGSPSPLAGSRFPLGLHDEPLGELPRERASAAAFRIEEVMKQAGRELAPEPYWEAKASLMEIWSKDAEPVYDANGELTVWEPKEIAA